MYFYQKDPTNTIILQKEGRRSYYAPLIDPKLSHRIHLQFDFLQDAKYCDIYLQDEFLEIQLKRFDTMMLGSKDIKEIIIELDLQYVEEETIFKALKSFIVDKLINQFKDTIEKLSIHNCNLSFLVQEENKNDEIQDFLLALITPLKNLSSLSIIDKFNQRNLTDENISSRLLSFIKNKPEIFQNISTMEVGLCYHFGKIVTKKQNPQFIAFIYNLAEQFSSINSLTSLKFLVNNMELDINQYQKISLEILKCKNLQKLSLDFSQEDQKYKNAIETLKELSNKNENVQEIEYIDTPFFKLQQIGEFTQQLNKFNNLSSLSLKKFKFQPGCMAELFSCLANFKSLVKLSLDMSDFEIKANEIQVSFKHFENCQFNLNSLDLTLPFSIKLKVIHTNPIIKFLHSQKESLEDLRLSFKFTVSDESLIEIMDSIVDIQNLQYFGLYFFKNNIIENKIIISSKEQGAKSIFEMKHIEINDKEWERNYVPINKLAISYILKYQKIGLESFTCIYLDYYSVKQSKLQKQYEVNMQEMQEVNSLKKIVLGTRTESSLIELDKLIKGNSQSLLHINDNSNFSSNSFQELRKCKNLTYLSISINIRDSNFSLKEICQSLENLQQLTIFQNNHFINTNYGRQVIIDCSDCVYSNYLTDLTVKGFLTTQNSYIQLIKDRKSQMLSLLVYQKLIQSQIIYKPSQSHWDIIF